MRIRSTVCVLGGVALVLSGSGRKALAHDIAGVQSYYSCRQNLALVSLRSPNPGALNLDYPLVVLDAGGNPTGEHIVVITVENRSEFDARVTAIGFAWPGGGSFELVQTLLPYNQLTTNENGVRRGSIGPGDYTIIPSLGIGQGHGEVTLSLRSGHQGVPGFPHTGLNVALVTGNTFAGGKPTAGLADDDTRHVMAIKGIVPAGANGALRDMETLLNDAYVRFRQVGPDGDGSETGIWTRLLPPVSCP